MSSLNTTVFAFLMLCVTVFFSFLCFKYARHLYVFCRVSQGTCFAVLKKRASLINKNKIVRIFEIRKDVPSEKKIKRLQKYYEGNNLNFLERAVIELTFANIKLRGYRKVKLLAYDDEGYLLEVNFL